MQTAIASSLSAAPHPPGSVAQAVHQLARVISEENAALRDMDFARAGSLLTIKLATADALDAAVRAAVTDASFGMDAAAFHDQVAACLFALVAENRKLHHRFARLQKRVHSLVARLEQHAPSSVKERSKQLADGCRGLN